MTDASQAANIAVVRRLCEQWPWLSREDFAELLAPDCDYRNIPISGDRHIGPDAAHKMVSGMRNHWDISLDVIHIVANGPIVLTERLEYFKHRKGEKPDCELPVMGAFELKDGKIIAWRDYFELSHAKSLLG
jgi:limonene-1,2-epoxide hydrolase